MGANGGSGFVPAFTGGGGGGGNVVSVTGNIVDNTDPDNPVVTQVPADMHETNPATPGYIANKIDWSDTYANIETVRAAAGLYPGMRYKITNRGTAGLIVTADSTSTFSIGTVFVANYSGTIVNELCIYDFIADRIIKRVDRANNQVTDSTGTFGCVASFPFGNAAYRCNTVTDGPMSLSATATLVEYNTFESLQVTIGATATVQRNQCIGPSQLAIAAGTTCRNLKMNAPNIVQINTGGTINNVSVTGTSSNVFVSGSLLNAIVEQSFFTVPSGVTMLGNYNGMVALDLSLYTALNPSHYELNIYSSLNTAINMTGTNTYTDTDIDSAGTITVTTDTAIDFINPGNLRTPIRIQPATGTTITINGQGLSGGGAGSFVLGNSWDSITLDAANNEYVLFTYSAATHLWTYVISVPTQPAGSSPTAVDLGVVNPDDVAQGITYGTGATTFLDAVINPDTGVFFTDPSAAAFFDLVTATIDVTTWTIDDAILDQCFRIMEGDMQFGKFQSPSNKTYVVNQKHLRPRTKTTLSTYRAYQFILDFQSSVILNISTVAGAVIGGQPADQNEAVNDANNWIQYNCLIANLQMHGIDDPDRHDIGFELASTYGSIFENCGFYNFWQGVKIVFGLQNFFVNCKFSDCSNIGTYVTWGDWSGGSVTGNGSNGTSFSGCKWRCAPGSIAGLYAEGSDGITVNGLQNVFEGSATVPAPTHHIVIDGLGATTNKMCTIENLHFEQMCDRSNIFITTSAQTMQLYFRGAFVQGINNAFIEADTDAGGVIQCNVEDIPDNSSGWLMRQNGAGSGVFNFNGARLFVLSSATDPANWDTSGIGVIPSGALVSMTSNIMW